MLALGLLLLVWVWIWLAYSAQDFAKSQPDAVHMVSRTVGSRIYYYPRVILWIRDYGLFVIMAWTFILGVIMASKRSAIRRGAR
jgi:hypothetical protein